MEDLDELDRNIIKELEKDGRKSYRKIAEDLDCSEGTVYNRVKKLEEEGVIKGFTVWSDPHEVGERLVVLIGVRVKGGHLAEVEKEMAEKKEVRCVYDVTGEYDALLMGRFGNREDLNRFIKNTLSNEWIERTTTHVVLNVVKEDFRTLV